MSKIVRTLIFIPYFILSATLLAFLREFQVNGLIIFLIFIPVMYGFLVIFGKHKDMFKNFWNNPPQK